MRVLVDTNILTRGVQPGHAQHAPALASMQVLKTQGKSLVIAAQSLYEFWVVATRPAAQNGLAMTITETYQTVVKLRSQFEILYDSQLVLDRWFHLVVHYDVSGKPAHDARPAAVTEANGINEILTFNGGDFKRYAWLTVYSPEDLTQSP